jgi:hypothetical protein
MPVRGLWGVTVVALIAAGCGAGTPRRSAGVHLNGKRVPGDYVFETDGSGARFLVPAITFAGQGRWTFDVARPRRASVGPNPPTNPASPYRVGVASATAVVPHSARVELLATGEPGRRFTLSWEETCGWTQEGSGAVGGIGGRGTLILRSPAVTLVKLPRISGGVPSCYLAAGASTATFTRHLHLAIIDY